MAFYLLFKNFKFNLMCMGVLPSCSLHYVLSLEASRGHQLTCAVLAVSLCVDAGAEPGPVEEHLLTAALSLQPGFYS